MRETKAQKEARRRVELAFYSVANGVQIDVFDIGKVFKVGEQSVAEGDDDETLKTKVWSFVQTIRKN